jgi:hypothetical protein
MTGTGKNIAIAAPGESGAIGVFAGCNFIDAAGNVHFSPYWPAGQVLEAGTKCEALVYDDPNIVFRIQADTCAEAAVGQLVDWVAGAGGNLKSGQSSHEAEGSATAAVDKSLRILGLVPEPGNDYGAHAEIEVMFAEHALKGVVAGVGGD